VKEGKWDCCRGDARHGMIWTNNEKVGVLWGRNKDEGERKARKGDATFSKLTLR